MFGPDEEKKVVGGIKATYYGVFSREWCSWSKIL